MSEKPVKLEAMTPDGVLSLSKFQDKARKALGDSPEATEITGVELVQLHADYYKSGQTFDEWFKATATNDEEGNLHLRKLRSWIIDLQSFSVSAYTADEARRKAVAMLESGEEKACIDAVVEDNYDVQEERGKREE
jgi:hypothetical protein